MDVVIGPLFWLLDTVIDIYIWIADRRRRS